jgi:hypothetical protein
MLETRDESSASRATPRQTYHVEWRYSELMRHEAETEGVSITEVVNRAPRASFDETKV